MESLINIMNPQIANHGITDKKVNFAHDFQLINVSRSTSSSSIDVDEEEHESSDEEEEEEISSPVYSSPLQDMSCLLQQLPFKRGLSKHYDGKSQSFTSLLSVTSLEDLAKPENPLNKKLKTCKSYGVFPRNNHTRARVVIRKKKKKKSSPYIINNYIGGVRSECLCSSTDSDNNRRPIPLFESGS